MVPYSIKTPPKIAKKTFLQWRNFAKSGHTASLARTTYIQSESTIGDQFGQNFAFGKKIRVNLEKG